MKAVFSFVYIGLLSGVAQSSPVHTFKEKCEAFAHEAKVEAGTDIQINIAEYRSKGAELDLKSEGTNETCIELGLSNPPPMPVDLCRLGMEVKTSSSSSIMMELWMPEHWEGRFLTTGTGGISGCIMYNDMAFGVSSSFAVVGTNAGHNGTSGGAFLNQPEVFADFAWRSIPTATTVGKDLVHQFYSHEANKSYYLGCSNAGRQAFKAVQDNPELFDGVVAGAPAVLFNNAISRDADYFRILNFTNPDAFLDRNHWSAVAEEVLNQCDELDGARDGILEDTRQCQPDLTPLLCQGSYSDKTCLSPAQLEAVQKIFSPFVVRGQNLYPRLQPGTEVNWFEALYGPFPASWAQDWFRDVIFSDVDWKLSSFRQRDALVSERRNPENVATFEGDLSAFRDRGGKVLHWHGQQDEFIPTGGSDRYYAHVAQTMGASSAELDDFYRYFRISGTGHCYGGAGANFIGQSFGLAASNKPEDNLLSRIVDWVERGNAPETVRGTKFVDNDPTKGVEYSRKHCKYPARNVYRGSGNGTDEDGWNCVED